MAVALDLALGGLILLSFYVGWRQGALASILSTVGVLAGLVVGLTAAPLAARATDSPALRLALLTAAVVGFVGLGNIGGAVAGGQLRAKVRRRFARWLDSILGAAFQAMAAALVLWFISTPLAASLPGATGEAVRDSKVLASIDAAAPDVLATLPARLAAMLNESGLPPLVSPFNAPRGAHVDAPDPDAVDPTVVERARPAVVQVMGDSGSCQRKLMGTGFVIEEDYVLTNAHVVAGTDTVALDTVVGVKPAEVVLYDPDADIAVLHADQLGIAPLPWARRELRTGDDALVMGFPLSGPFEAAPARVRGRLHISGPDIYAQGRVEREAYTIRGNVRQGNSGGPLLNPEGEVAGMIFGASLDSSETGYALTAAQIAQRVGEVTGLRASVGTQSCVG